MIPLLSFIALMLAFIAFMLVTLWFELRRNRRPHETPWPQPVVRTKKPAPSGETPPPVIDPATEAKERLRVREKVRKQFPTLGGSKVDSVTDEIIEKAKTTLGRIG